LRNCLTENDDCTDEMVDQQTKQRTNKRIADTNNKVTHMN